MTKLTYLVCVLLFAASVLTPRVDAQTPDITYQGQLEISSAPANGNFDFEFLLFDSMVGGSQVGSPLQRNGVAVANGIFSVNLNFGSVFTGANRFLEIRVRAEGGGGFTTLSPRQPVTSTPYSIKSLTADTATNSTNAVNAASATTAASFSGPLSGDVTGTQGATTVARLRGRTVAATVPLGGQVLKYNGTTNQWEPDTDIAGTGGGGGTITGVAPGTGLSGGGATGNVTLNIANGGVGTTQLADNGVTDAKISSVSGGKVTGPVATATNAATATNFTGPLSGDVTGTQAATAVTTVGGQSAANVASSVQTVTGATQSNTPNTLVRRDASGNFAAGVITGNLTGNASTATNATTATTAATATDALSLGGTPANQYLQTNGNGSGLTNLNASSITTGTLSNARLGQIPTANIADSAVTAPKIASGQVVKGVTVGANTLSDNVTLAAGSNITLTPAGNTVTIASTGSGGGVGGGGTVNSIPLWNGATTLGDSQIRQSGAGIQLPNDVQFAIGAQGYQASMGSPNGETGLSISNPGGARADLRFDGSTVKLVARPAGSGPPAATSGITVTTAGRVGIGAATPGATLDVANAGGLAAIRGVNSMIVGNEGYGVWGESNYPFGIAIYGKSTQGTAGYFEGRVVVSSILTLGTLSTGGETQLCWNASHVLSTCSSSIRYKKNLLPYTSGISVINKLRPISFNWKADDAADVGFGAEDVEQIDPLFVTRNDKGQIEGVKYDRLSVLFVNAFKEQQSQIEAQQRQIELLTKAVCSMNPKADICPQN